MGSSYSYLVGFFLVEFLWNGVAKWQVVEWCGFLAVASAARFDGSSRMVHIATAHKVPGVQMSGCHYSSYLLLEMPLIQIPDSFQRMLILSAVTENSFEGEGLLCSKLKPRVVRLIVSVADKPAEADLLREKHRFMADKPDK